MWFGASAPEGENTAIFLTPWFFAIKAIVTVRQCCGFNADSDKDPKFL